MSRLWTWAGTAALVLAVGVGSARADLPRDSFYVGPTLGLTLALDDWDIHEIPDAGVSPGFASFTGGLRVGASFGYWLSLEGVVTVTPYELEDDAGSGLAVGATADLLVNLLSSGDWVPFVAVGGGLYSGQAQELTGVSGDLDSDPDWRAQYGAGIRGLVTDRLIVRLDARHVITDGYEGSARLANNLEVLAGLDILLWQGAEEPEDDDLDDDGIPDGADACPETPGVESAAGCPDRDGDGIADADDRCPDMPGPAETQGCPDTDGDGLVDIDDRCPEDAGPPETQGCPDTDGDGLVDVDDACPEAPGPEETKGCPDRDGDGVVDADDNCPDEPGPPENLGCPEKKAVVLEGVRFEVDRATLRPEALPILDRVARTLKDYPKMRVEIVGHTDSSGEAAYNQGLSMRRAKAVRQYLHDEHGIALDRMEIDGRGEAEPRASNATAEGRFQNRRIQFRLLSKE